MQQFEQNWKSFISEQIKFSPEIEAANQRLAQEIKELISQSRPVREDILDMIEEGLESFFDIKPEILDDVDFDDFDMPIEEFYVDFVDGRDYLDDPQEMFEIYFPLLLQKNPKSFLYLMSTVVMKFLQDNPDLHEELFDAVVEFYGIGPKDDGDKFMEIMKSVYESIGSALADAVT